MLLSYGNEGVLQYVTVIIIKLLVGRSDHINTLCSSYYPYGKAFLQEFIFADEFVLVKGYPEQYFVLIQSNKER